jgi:TatD DNase family protein
MTLFDSHTHLDDRRFHSDRDFVINRARAAGVRFLLNPGADLASSTEAVKLAEAHEDYYAAVGVHPHEAKTVDDQVMALIKHLARSPKVVAIGEIGLDYHYDHSERSIQREVFRQQIRLAKSLALPIIIHDREAHADVLRNLKEEEAFDNGVLLHCYSGSAEMARQYVELGAMISLAGPVTFKNAKKPAEVAQEVPLEHLLIETDAPYLSPTPHRGKRNEPAHVKLVCERIAELRGITAEAVAEATTNNALRFFKIKDGR